MASGIEYYGEETVPSGVATEMNHTSEVSYRLIYELGNAFAGQLEIDPLLELVTRKCREVLAAEGAAILLLDPQRNELYFPYLSDLDPEVARRLSSLRFPANLGIAGEALRLGRGLKVDDAAREEHHYSLIDRHTGLTTRTILAAPLIANKKRLGVVEVVNSLRGETFSNDDLALLELLADSIALAIDNATRVGQLQSTERSLRTQVGALRRDLARHELLNDIVGASPQIAEILRLIGTVATTPISVLIEGETGTGKELLARTVHRMSDRADRPFLAINCAALSEHLLESELFGHRRGAFTGAINDQPGLFKAASGGVIFLDEIGEMPLGMQPKLLRVLQDGEIIPVGSTRPERVDVRVIAASNRDLKAAVAAGTFRADLYYRLAAFPVTLPPLRERRGDIALLAARFLTTAAERQHKMIHDLDPCAIAVLENYDWPGNVRELQNEIERAVALTASGDSIKAEVLSEKIGHPPIPAVAKPAADTAPIDNYDLRSARAAFESHHITEVLAANQNNVSRSARILGISRISLQRKMREYKIR
jgi:transcriptional regulator with GAF, ATPase, and Fis domain